MCDESVVGAFWDFWDSGIGQLSFSSFFGFCPGYQELSMVGVAGWPGYHVGSTVARDATGEGSEDSMRGRGMWEAGGMGSLEGVDAGVWLGSSGERGVVTGRLRPSYTTVYWGGGWEGR